MVSDSWRLSKQSRDRHNAVASAWHLTVEWAVLGVHFATLLVVGGDSTAHWTWSGCDFPFLSLRGFHSLPSTSSTVGLRVPLPPHRLHRVAQQNPIPELEA